MAKLLIKRTNICPLKATVDIPLIGGGFTSCDEDEYWDLARYPWRHHKGKYKSYAYMRCPISSKVHTIKMHRFIMDCPADMEVHHIDLNGLNNCRSNLEILSPSNHRLKHGKSK